MPPIDTPDRDRPTHEAGSTGLENGAMSQALNVMAGPYYAMGDGVADDGPAIQRAIDDSHQAGGGYVFLPPGVYSLATESLILKDVVTLFGAGMFNAVIRLGDGLDKPVITDRSAGVAGGYASGRVRLANFTVDGNRANNAAGQEGIFMTAYYSVFENLWIHDCRTHGLHLGGPHMANYCSQNRVVGCRITDCGAVGIYLDTNAVDHTITENYVNSCDCGVLIKNGGVRLMNNRICDNTSAGIQVNQTSYDCIIAGNDLQGNRRHGIHVTRTTVPNSGPWSQILISGNSIMGDGLESNDKYDGVYVEGPVPEGIAKLSILGNKVFTLDGPTSFRYGINLAKNVIESMCSSNHVTNVATARYNVGPSCSGIEIDRLGGGVLEPPAIPESGTPLLNPYHAPVTVHIGGGNVSAVAISGELTGLAGGSFRLPAQQTIALSYSERPMWTWFAD